MVEDRAQRPTDRSSWINGLASRYWALVLLIFGWCYLWCYMFFNDVPLIHEARPFEGLSNCQMDEPGSRALKDIYFKGAPETPSTPRSMHPNPIARAKSCVEDIKAQNGGQVVLPETLKHDGLLIPFYVFPEGVPEDAVDAGHNSTSWSDCWLYRKTNDSIKRASGYFAARELENHPWRVYRPEEAMVFVAPWFDDSGRHHVNRIAPKCSACFLSHGGWTEVMEMIGEKYKEFINPYNTLWMMGDFFSYEPWHDKVYFKTTAEDRHEKLQTGSYGGVTASFWRESRRWRIKPNELFMQDPVSAQCTADDKAEGCRELEQQLTEENGLTPEEWRNQRTVGTVYLGKSDNRNKYASRRALFSAIHWLSANRVPSTTLLSMQPYLILDSSPTGRAEDLLTTCAEEEAKRPADYKTAAFQWTHADERTLPSLLMNYATADFSPGHSSWWDRMTNRYHPKNYSRMSDDFNKKNQHRLRSHSRFVMGLRGDTVSSQRSYENLYYGNLVMHDVSEDLFKFFAPGPFHVPWKLLGLFDNEKCIANETIRLMNESGRFGLMYAGSSLPPLSIGNIYQKSVGALRSLFLGWDAHRTTDWAAAYLDCFAPVAALAGGEDDEVLGTMLQAIRKYRHEALWEIENSKVAENLIFETARLMVFDGRHDEILKRFSIDRDMFKPKLPSSCLLAGGEGVYEQQYHMQEGSHEMWSTIRDVTLEDWEFTQLGW